MVTTNARQYQRRRTNAQWVAENPVLSAGEIGVVLPSTPASFKIGDGTTAWNDLPDAGVGELVAAEPSEVDLDTVGDITTLTLTNEIAHNIVAHGVGLYYLNGNDATTTPTMIQNTVHYLPVWLSKGVVDRIGGEVVTNIASAVLRCGIYATSAGKPAALVAEASGTGDASTAGAKDLTIAATIAQNGVYWLAAVIQGAGGVTLRGMVRGSWVPAPAGTSVPTGTTQWVGYSQVSVTGALPGTAAPGSANAAFLRLHYRYSSVG